MRTYYATFNGQTYTRTSARPYNWAAFNSQTKAGRRSAPVSFHTTFAAARTAAGSTGRTAAVKSRKA